ncbi:MAG: (d)CMP kinase [Firmicutes bacterium]|nr:(d)CMP kinase [Bacillota bacterium]
MAQLLRIAIDGPAGAGKSTVAKILAKRLGYTYVDTGAMYRSLTLLAIRNGVAIDSEAAVSQWLRELQFSLDMKFDGDTLAVHVNGEDVTEAIRTAQVSNAVTVVAQYQCVREFLLAQQKQWAQRPGVIMDGRDIGTVIMPNAEVKFFLVAGLRERALRRQAELEKKGQIIPLEEIEDSIARRDAQDAARQTAPLAQAEDAIEIDTTALTIDEVVELMIAHIEQAMEG